MGSVDKGSISELDGLAVTEILEQDPRPTFVLDLDSDSLDSYATEEVITPLFCNEALRSHHKLLDAVCGGTDSDDPAPPGLIKSEFFAFKTWITSVTKFDDTRDVYPLTYHYQGLLWTGATVRRRWRLISGNQSNQSFDTVSHTLSAGLPSEVATGSFSHTQRSDKFSDRDLGQGLAPLVSPTLLMNKAEDGKDEASTTLVSLSDLHKGDSSVDGVNTVDPFLTLTTPERGVPDCTVRKPVGPMSAHVMLVRSINWGSTPLGPMRKWSRELRQAVNLVIGNPHPAALFWGSEMTTLYNEAYGNEVAGNKHPRLLGTGFAGPFSEVWQTIRPLFVECARTGESIRRENHPLMIERYGFLEETFFSWSFTPLYGGTSKILGFYNAPFETTENCIGQRRMQTLQKLGQTVNGARTVREFWQCVLEGLEDNHYDVPFALLYSVADSDDTDESSITSGSTMSLKSCLYEGSIGVPNGHPAAPHKLDLKRSREGFIPSFREAMRTREPTKLQTRDGTLPEALLEGLNWRGFGDPCKEAIIFPLRPTTGDMVLAFLLLGVNPRRPYDEEYKAFTALMNRQLATALASVMLFEEETLRNKMAIEAAILKQEHLNQQLAVQTDRMRRMATLSPLGMCYLNPEGLILEANDRYYEMTSQSRDDIVEMCWMNHLVESSKLIMEEGWRRLTVDLHPWSSELQLNKRWIDVSNPQAETMDYWVLCNAHPELDGDGHLRSIMGSITDISHLKWGQGLQDRRLREAEETRHQQNEFIDITSHEMRNPLSAILQCADDIASSMLNYRANPTEAVDALLEDCIESANTITLCVQHQKSIVDDILTVSKLDSNLLVLTPVVAQPIRVVQQALRMFESELSVKRIKLDLVIHPSFEEISVDWVSLDPSRMSQIVINFMTNAIKFTADSEVRKITVSMGASTHAPTPVTQGFKYIPRKNAETSSALGDDWSSGENVYIRLKVQDTGCGLTQDEIRLLFQRFQQASPRTHAQYGGSGLGLFISRQLTELHGGQIGVASEAGIGSTFGFYVRTRRATPSTDLAEAESIRPPEHAWHGKGQTQLDNLPLVLLSGKTKAPPASSIEIASSPAIPSPYVSSSSIPSVNRTNKVPKKPANSVQAPISGPVLSLLVVEDNLVNQKVLMKQLSKAGCRVAAADNGQLALEYIETTEFRVGTGKLLSAVLMDLEMPVMDGLTCVRHIRRMEAEGSLRRHVPVIAVTANVRQAQVEAAKQAGMDLVVSKPFRVADLLTQVDALLRQPAYS